MDKKRILLVEDEKDISRMTKSRLESDGYEVMVAYDGHMALQEARSKKPDLIILDVMMPKMDGYKVCRMLKYDSEHKDIPIVMLTARALDSDKKTGEEVGTDAYIVKPFKWDVLTDKICELLGK
ncbi:MAG: response regulator [Candidatus Gorgyraea atricola]|nr:response regulator [Candidatus Gorgyraea atricola]